MKYCLCVIFIGITSNSSVFSTFETPASKSPLFTFGKLETTTAITPASVSFKFGKSETVNQISSSDSQDSENFTAGSTVTTFTFGSRKETSKENSNAVSDTADKKYESPMGFTFGTKKETSSVSQKQDDSAPIKSIFGNTFKSRKFSLFKFVCM